MQPDAVCTPILFVRALLNMEEDGKKKKKNRVELFMKGRAEQRRTGGKSHRVPGTASYIGPFS
jgi:hypothetical protein